MRVVRGQGARSPPTLTTHHSPSTARILSAMDDSSLEGIIAKYDSMLVGFSGGVDSALLSVVARRVLGKERTVAAVGTSPSLASTQLEQARQLADQFDLNLVEVPTHELDDPNYAANSTMRCLLNPFNTVFDVSKISEAFPFNVS